MSHLSTFLNDNATCHPDDTAIVVADETTSWAQLKVLASCLSGDIQVLGVPRGGMVAVLADASTAYAVACYGVAWGGHILVPLNTRLTPTETLEQLEDCDAGLVLVDDAFADHASRWPQKWQKRMKRLRADGQIGSGANPVKSVDWPTERVSTLLYTGGTTGRPKGVRLSSAALISNASVVSNAIGLNRTDRCLLTAPMFHISGLAMIWATAASGATCLPLAQFEPGKVLRCLREQSVSAVFLVPTMIRMILDHDDFDASRFATLHSLLYGASPISERLLRDVLAKLPHVRLTQAYGQTEICPLTLLVHEDHVRALDGRPELLRSAGRAVDGIELRIEDASGRTCQTGEPGEVLGRGGSMMECYHRQDEVTRETVVGGFISTGDIGFLDAEGYLTLVDRSKDMIVTGGENVYSTEVENTLSTHPSVHQAAVIAVPDDKWVERVHAVVVLHEEVTENELVNHCRRTLAGYKCPKSFSIVNSLPLTAVNKIDKKKLRHQFGG